MKITRNLAKKAFIIEMGKYRKEFIQACTRSNFVYVCEFSELIDFGLCHYLPTELIHRLIKKEIQRVVTNLVEEQREYARDQMDQRLLEQRQLAVENYTPIPILTFAPQSTFQAYLDTVDYTKDKMSTIKTRGYCFGLTVPEIEAMVEEHRTKL